MDLAKYGIKPTDVLPDNIEHQITLHLRGAKFAPLKRSATINDGIAVFSPSMIEKYFVIGKKVTSSLVKFVPMSGAGTRMFKSLLRAYHGDELDENDKIQLEQFKEGIANKSFACLHHHDNYEKALFHLLSEEGLHYSAKPKALMLFHKYGTHERTGFDEHVYEARRAFDCSSLHCTINTEFYDNFIELAKPYEELIDISFSFQDASTNTIAWDKQKNVVFRDESGNILFRPGGHGALIHNLNDIHSPYIFVKNVDNIAREDHAKEYEHFLVAMLGYLHEKKTKVDSYLKDVLDNKNIEKAVRFASQELGLPATNQNIVSLLDRPMRVVMVVKNQGEPGGGLFYLDNNSLQIIESSEISPDQKHIMQTATHFNPVLMHVATTRFDGTKYDLTRFVDNEAVFISQKSYNGKSLQALELPGLWNRAMGNYTTVAVEVPLELFTPVKTFTDLLRDEH